MRAASKISTRLDLRRAGDVNVNFSAGRKAEGAVYQGMLGSYRLWTYAGWYIDAGGTEQQIWPDNTVVLVGDALEGVQAYGAIRDLKAGVAAGPYFFKSWEEENPSVRWILMQSAPLLYPRRPNASYKLIVHS